MKISSVSAVKAVLTGSSFVVPPLPPLTPNCMSWLRSAAPRFANGLTHTRRRRIVEEMLQSLDVPSLRKAAEKRTGAILAAAGERPIDVMADIARFVPVEVLADALDLTAVQAADVVAAAAAYPPASSVSPCAVSAVERLVKACGGSRDEPTAARIGILVQAADATAGLIGTTAVRWLRTTSRTLVEDALADTQRHDPPVRITKRLAISNCAAVGVTSRAGDQLLEVDLAAASGADPSLAFGYGPHACPGRELASTIAAGVVEQLRRHRLAEPDIAYLPSPNLRVPEAVWVIR